MKTDSICINKVVGGGGDSEEIFPIHLNKDDKIFAGNAPQNGKTSDWMTLDIKLVSYRTVDLVEFVPIEHSPDYEVSI